MNLMNRLKTMDFDCFDVQQIVNILINRKYLVSGILRETPESRDAIGFFMEFWDYDRSPYAKENAVLGSQLSHAYFANQLGRIKNYWTDLFKGKYLGEITPENVTEIFQSPKLEGLAPKTVKGILDAVTIPLRWAYQKHLTQITGFDRIPHVKIKSKERQIVPMKSVPDVFQAKWENEMYRLANLLSMYTGMRAGEVQALRVEDVHPTFVHVCHSWDKYIGLKSTKNGEERDCPISKELYEALMNQVSFNLWKDAEGDKGFIFFGECAEKPVSQRGFNKYLHRALKEIGYENPESISFHCWRHEFCTETKRVVSDDRVIREVSGHKSQQMFEHYSKHIQHAESMETMGNAAQQIVGDIVTKTLKSPVQES